MRIYNLSFIFLFSWFFFSRLDWIIDGAYLTTSTCTPFKEKLQFFFWLLHNCVRVFRELEKFIIHFTEWQINCFNYKATKCPHCGLSFRTILSHFNHFPNHQHSLLVILPVVKSFVSRFMVAGLLHHISLVFIRSHYSLREFLWCGFIRFFTCTAELCVTICHHLKLEIAYEIASFKWRNIFYIYKIYMSLIGLFI